MTTPDATGRGNMIRRRGIVTTGDNRKASYEDLGVNPCWMRLGESTAEALRQAVLADEARITYSEPAIPSQRLLELRVSSALTGTNFEVTFNDGFNALIRGRGSGKWAILEYLRFGLGRSTLDATEDAATNRERDLIASTLVGGFVETSSGTVLWRRGGARSIGWGPSPFSRARNLAICLSMLRRNGSERVPFPRNNFQRW